jgi:hypothetical protein
MTERLSFGKRLWRALGILGITGAAALIVYGVFVRPWVLTWGASQNEVLMPLPGDNLVPHPTATSTRAITIHAPARKVWPWLMQMGQDRGGFYSYTFLENLLGADIHNRDHIVAEWQERRVGDLVRSVPADYLDGRLGKDIGWYIERLEPNRLLVLRGWGAFVLHPIDGQRTRLIIRTSGSIKGPWRILDHLILQPVHFIMERRMLLGIKEQAEAGGGVHIPSAADLTWFLLMVAAGMGIFAIALSNRWPRSLIVSVLAGILLVLALFLLPPAPFFSGTLLLLILLALTWAYWPQRQR